MPARRSTALDSIDDALLRGASQIQASPAIDVWQEWQPRSDAEGLLSHILGYEVRQRDLKKSLTAAQSRHFDGLVQRRVVGEPVALIIGSITFAGLKLGTRRGVFVPRLSSEIAALQAAQRLRRFKNGIGVDVATGSGPLALTMAAKVPEAQVWGLDIDPDAVALCRSNARRLGLRNVKFRVSDLFSALPRVLRGQVAVVTIHPPYVASGELNDLPREILDYEPKHTLSDASDDGLGLARAVAVEVGEWLRPGGWLMVEVGPHLLRKTQSILKRAGLSDVSWARDDIGVTRIVFGRRR